MSTKGRKTTAAATAEKPPIDHEDIKLGEMALQIQAEQQQAAQENAVVLAEQLGYDGALTVGGLEEEIRFYQRRTVEAVLETGKRLVILKELAGHGEFLKSLERLDIAPRAAQRLMQATLKFSNASTSTLLSLPNLNESKMIELLVLDEEEIEALDQGETVRGVKLDDVDCMSVSELRRALRTAKADHAAELADKDRVIAQKTNKIEELVEAKNRREGMTEAERQAELEQALVAATLDASGYLLPVRQAVHDIRALDKCPVGLSTALEGALNRIVAEVMGIASDYGVVLNLTPDWIDGGDGGENGSDWLQAGESATRA